MAAACKSSGVECSQSAPSRMVGQQHLSKSVHFTALLTASQLHLDVHPCRQVQLHELVDGLRGEVGQVQQPLVRPRLKVLPRVLVHVRRAQDAVDASPAAARRPQPRPTAQALRRFGRRSERGARLVGRKTGPLARAPVLLAALFICASACFGSDLRRSHPAAARSARRRQPATRAAWVCRPAPGMPTRVLTWVPAPARQPPPGFPFHSLRSAPATQQAAWSRPGACTCAAARSGPPP